MGVCVLGLWGGNLVVSGVGGGGLWGGGGGDKGEHKSWCILFVGFGLGFWGGCRSRLIVTGTMVGCHFVTVDGSTSQLTPNWVRKRTHCSHRPKSRLVVPGSSHREPRDLMNPLETQLV